jgi:Na+/H+ antiporter NhaC
LLLICAGFVCIPIGKLHWHIKGVSSESANIWNGHQLKSKKIIKIAVVIIILGLGCGLLAYFSPRGEENQSAVVWYSIVPPMLAILLAFLTQHVLLSLGVAIIAGGFLSAVPQAPLSADAWMEGLRTAITYVTDTVTSSTNLLVLSFIPPIFIMIEVIMVSGGFRGIILWLLKWVKGRKSAQAATALMGVLCFIDDYTNAIVVGSMMQPMTDRFRVSREKLAFIVDATSAPVAGIAVVSTWIAYEVGLLRQIAEKLEIDKSGYSMFFDALSFRFYCLLMIVFVFVQIFMDCDFGPMRAAQERERAKDSPEENLIKDSKQKSGRAINALIPLAGLLLFHFTGLWFDGTSKLKNDMLQWQAQSLTAVAEKIPPKPVDIEALSPGSWIYWREVIGHAENSPLVLACAALFGLTLALLFSQIFGSLGLPIIINCFKRGFKRALLPFVILITAWSLKNCCDDLKTGEFLTTILAGRVSPYLFPPILFFVASLTSFATGTSYGTMAILIPTAIPVAYAMDQGYGLTTMISIGAVLDGAIFGDHCSPISDTTIISSTASSCELMRHVRTQLPYSLTVAAIALIFGYIPSALGLPAALSFALAVLVIVVFLAGLSCFRRLLSV